MLVAILPTTIDFPNLISAHISFLKKGYVVTIVFTPEPPIFFDFPRVLWRILTSWHRYSFYAGAPYGHSSAGTKDAAAVSASHCLVKAAQDPTKELAK